MSPGPISRRFLEKLPFEPDQFQTAAAEALEEGFNVVVTAPTGAGKTLVAEVAIHLALDKGRRAFYTTPIKALSNQKYKDLCNRYGPERVGILTGDNAIGGDAPIVVMTAEVLRNMLYTDPEELAGVGVAILDEVHYLADRARGAVWEEIVIHAPPRLQMVCLSATVSNASEFTGWVTQCRGETRLVRAAQRPVPLRDLYAFRDRWGPEHMRLLPTFVHADGRKKPNPRISSLLSSGRNRRRFAAPRRPQVVEGLFDEGLLPAIYFIFSRAGCEAAAASVRSAGIRLIPEGNRKVIRQVAEAHTAHLSDADLGALDYAGWVDRLEAGVGAHHAGMVPAFKEATEELFAAGLLGVVFATETLALGINMPARTVVLESLTKFTGETHEALEPGDYTQLTGRAGRRGIDTEGFGIVLYSRYVPFQEVVKAAGAGAHPLVSSFRITYNMVANLVANYPAERASDLLSASFANYQQASRLQAEKRLAEELSRKLDQEERAGLCERGSVFDYLELLGQGKARRGNWFETLRIGDVFEIPSGRRSGRYVVVRRFARRSKAPRVLAVSESGSALSMVSRDLVEGTVRMGHIEVPTRRRSDTPALHREMAAKLRRLPSKHRASPQALQDSRLRDHPVADCPDLAVHLRHARRAIRIRRRLAHLQSGDDWTTESLQNRFKAVRTLMEERGYLSGWEVTPAGDRLRLIYNERDLLVSEAVIGGLFGGLNPAETAALGSAFVYDPRNSSPPSGSWPTARLARRWERLVDLCETLNRAELSRQIEPTRIPEPGCGDDMYRWANGASLTDLVESGQTPGDLVRTARQLVDLLRQLRDAFPQISGSIRSALRSIDRGVVAAHLNR
ncbi:MAG: DEAD/DEAH box helicase [Acidimicrobiia bacterium]|nr:DEAD/DEAH box helicase [Acidimicrobiia bacterium]